jgi:hypothetical protein
MLLPVYLWLEIVAFIISLFCCPHFKEKNLKYFVPFLFFIVFYESADFINFFNVKGSNHWALNFITTFEFLFYSFFIRSLLLNNRLRKISLVLISTTIILTIINIAFIQGFWNLHSYTFLLGAVVIIYLVCTYFYQLINQEMETISIITLPYFWINTGLLFFYLGQFVFFAFFQYMAYIDDYSYLKIFRFISSFTNVILYIALSVGFLCKIKVIKK